MRCMARFPADCCGKMTFEFSICWCAGTDVVISRSFSVLSVAFVLPFIFTSAFLRLISDQHVILLKIRWRRHAPLLHHLPRQRLHELLHRHHLPILGREKGSVERHVADIPTRNRELLGEKWQVD